MFLRWMWLKKQSAIPYCVSRSCHLFLLRKRETVWLATRNTDHGFNRGSRFVSGLFTAAKLKIFTYTDNLFHCSCEAHFCFRSRFRRSFCFSAEAKEALTLSLEPAPATLPTQEAVWHWFCRWSCFVLSQVIYLLYRSEEDWPKTPARNTVFRRLCL